jgi:hypothetical protein
MVRFILEKLHLNGDVAKHIVGAYITFAETCGLLLLGTTFKSIKTKKAGHNILWPGLLRSWGSNIPLLAAGLFIALKSLS